MENCSNCGHELNEDMVFCPICGAPANGELNNVQHTDEDDNPWYETDIFNVAIAPIVRSFDNGKFFLSTAKILIDIIVSTFLISQPLLAYATYNSNELSSLSSADKTVELIFAIILLIIAVFSFGYWMKRIRRLYTIFNPDDDFVVIPLGTYLFQWLGEWIALVLSIGGIFAIIVPVANVKTSSVILTFISSYGYTGGFIAIILSIIIVFVFRLIAEEVRVLAAIANNTNKKRTIVTKNESEKDSNDLRYNILYAVCIIATVGFILAAMFSK